MFAKAKADTNNYDSLLSTAPCLLLIRLSPLFGTFWTLYLFFTPNTLTRFARASFLPSELLLNFNTWYGIETGGLFNHF